MVNRDSYINHLNSEIENLRQDIVFCESTIQNCKRQKENAIRLHKIREWIVYRRDISISKKRMRYDYRLVRRYQKLVVKAAKIRE